MRQLTVRILLLATVAVFFVEPRFTALAQEAVSTTTGGTTSSSATTSTGTTGGLSSTTGGAPSAAVTGSAGGAPTAERSASGTGVFSPTPVQIYATVSGGYDDNVGTSSSNQQSSAFTSGNVILDYTFGEPRLQLALNLGAGGTYYFEHIAGAQDYDLDFKGALGITYKASPRLTLGATILLDYLTEPTFQYPGGLNSRNGNYFYTTDKFFANYEWSRRFATRTSYAFEAYDYANSGVAAFSNRITNIFGNEFRFQMVPTTSLIAEYRYGIVSYETASLNSNTHYALGGIDHTFNPRLTATFRGGAEFRSYDSAGDQNGPYFEGSVSYALGRRTSVGWTARYGLEEPDLANTQSRNTFRTGLQAKFDLTSRIGFAGNIYYVHDDYNALVLGNVVNDAFSDDTFDIDFSFRYGITRLIGLQVGYHYTDASSDVATREYSRNRVFGGVNVTF